jgi:hypothetical protein
MSILFPNHFACGHDPQMTQIQHIEHMPSTMHGFQLPNKICICILYVIWVSSSLFAVRQNQFSFKESYEALTHQKHHTWKNQKEWGRGRCAMTIFAMFMLLLFHIIQLYNNEWHDDSHNSSKRWCHNWFNFIVAPHLAISSLRTHTTS